MGLHYIRRLLSHDFRKLSDDSAIETKSFPNYVDVDSRCAPGLDELV
jgi:hypothetical protein